jgi:MATE family multidrug resistance protein
MYLVCMLPAACVYGLNDIQNKFLIQMNKSHHIFGTQSSALLLHIMFNYIFVTLAQLDIYGCALATTMTWCYIYLLNNWKLHNETDLKDALSVSIFDPRVRSDMSSYLSIGLPNMVTIIIEFIAYEITVLYLGHIGIVNQATQIVLLNFLSIILMISFGYQQAACALVGQKVGANKVYEAKKIWHKLLFLFAVSDVVLWCLLFWNRQQVVKIYTQEKKVQ